MGKSHIIKILPLLIILFIVTAYSIIPNSSFNRGSHNINMHRIEAGIDDIMAYVNSPEFIDNVEEHVRYLSSLGSRVTGQPGCHEAARYIASKFEEYGLKPGGDDGYLDYFNITVPIDRDVRIMIPQANVTIDGYALWPNGIQACYTPPEGIEGILVYFHNGSLEEISKKISDLKLKDLSDVIAIMDFNTYKSWFNLVSFKVKAIIFIEPGETNRLEAESKFTLTPLPVPRIYIHKEDSHLLFENLKKRARLCSDMRYQNVKSENVVGIIEGTEYKNDIIVVSSYFDSWSIIPRISPGADEATGVAVLLEVARFFSINKPRRTMWFVAFSGHWQALRGARHFVEERYFAPEVQSDAVRIWVHFNLDFSTDSENVAWVHYGSMWIQDKVAGLFDDLFTVIEGYIYPALESKGFNVTKYVDRPTMPYMNHYFIHDAEPSVIAGIAGFSFITSRSMRLHRETPFDVLEKVKFNNLIPQTTFALTCINSITNMDTLPLKWGTDYVKPVRRYMRSGGGYPGRKGFAGIYGDVVRFEPETRWYTSEGLEGYDIILDVVISPSRFNPFAHTILKLESNSSLNFRIEGIGVDYIFPETGYGAHYVGAGEIGVPAVRIYAYAINKTTGEIEWAPDLGVWMWPQNLGFTTDRPDGWKDVRVSLFKCESVILTDIIDPLTFERPWVGLNWRLSTFERFTRVGDTPTMHKLTLTFEVRDFYTHGHFLQWGMLTPSETEEPFAMIFLPANSTFEVILRAGGQIEGVLINANETYKEGVGFKIGEDEMLYLSLPLQVANDLFWLNEKRLGIVSRYKAYSMWVLKAYGKSRKYYDVMVESLSKGDYKSALGSAILTWAWSSRAYQELINLINGLTYTFVFFSSLLVPFAFLMERLLIQSEGLKRLFWMILIYIISFLVLSSFHPGFEIALSTPVAVMSFVQLAMSAITLALLAGITGGHLKEIRAKVRGLHFAEISRTGATLLAASLGIQQMRRRKFRTALTLITISIISFTLVLLTSATGDVIVKSPQGWSGATYDGLLINSNLGIEYVGTDVITMLSPFLKGSDYMIIRRAWVYPPPFENIGPDTRQFWILRSNETSAQVYAILGLEPTEIYASGVDKALIAGKFFLKEDLYACIMGKKMADKLKVKLGSEVYISGMRLYVTGIFDEDKFSSIIDLDRAVISPIDFNRIRIEMAGSPLTPEMLKLMAREYRTAPEYLLIVPYRLAREILDAPIYSIVVKAPHENLLSIVDEIPLVQYALTCFLGDPATETTSLYSAALFIVSRGWISVSFPIFIAALMILNLMLGALYERLRELSTLGSIGLSPIHIASLLIIEGLLYGVIGTVLGYIPGIIGCRILLSLGMIPEGFVPGFASIYILLITGLIVAMLLAATSYPAFKASKMVTPGLIRRFRLRTKAVGGTLEVPMPFFATESDIYAILGYIAEYINACRVEGVGPFITLTEAEFSLELSGFTRRLIVKSNVKVPPYDANITQAVRVVATREIGVDRYNIILQTTLLTGSPEVWEKSNERFVRELRGQFLLWRTLTEEERARYIEVGERIKRKFEEESESK